MKIVIKIDENLLPQNRDRSRAWKLEVMRLKSEKKAALVRTHNGKRNKVNLCHKHTGKRANLDILVILVNFPEKRGEEDVAGG